MTDETPDIIEAEDVPMITYRENYIDANGVQAYHEHVVPVAEWPAYEKEHGL